MIGSSDVSETPRVRYEGYKFFKADPIPGQRPTWTKVERMEMHLSEGELCKKVQKRANKVSAAQQYQNLSKACQAHINQLIHEKRQTNIKGDWSCVYAKQRERPSKPRNARPSDYEIVSMQVILMQRPLQTTSYPRTPMGDLVDLEPHFGSSFQQDESDGGEDSLETANWKLKSKSSQPRHRSLPPYRRPRSNQMWRSGTTAEGDQTIPELPTRPFTSNIAPELNESNCSKESWPLNAKKAAMKEK
ncbi:hypothetical protein N7478_009270 [Penicillium angulare]|uniref:uncharacterized protein n=1 Tax=Penicillium angulare TaxID=116970 RepID=UPI002540703A|nr:uncharacterized protein N7478_009270 [Penicillium angulare]KAJ5266462.1 hypothetical protein N7478_009270 [Penicillium angulare]